jgi:hypothetical protein
MKFTKLAIGAMLMTSAAFASAAAPTYTSTPTLTLNSGGIGLTGTIGNSFGASAGATFLDTYSFAVNTKSNLTGFAGSFFAVQPNGGGQPVNVIGLDITSFDLYSGNTKIATGVKSNQPSFTFQTLTSSSPLTVGSYSLKVGGTVKGLYGGSYGGNINIVPVVAPVPEPETWGMMATGLAAVGVLARRRRTSKKSIAA